MIYRRLPRRASLILGASAPRFDDDTDYEDENPIVFNPEVSPSFELADTGLVDPEGNPIMRDDSAPMGFLAPHTGEEGSA